MKYIVEPYTYPERLQGDPDLQHYIQFRINIRGASKYKDDYVKNYGAEQISFGETGRLNPNNVGRTVNSAARVAGGTIGAAVGVKGALSAIAYAGGLTSKAKIPGAVATILVGGIGGLGVGGGVVDRAVKIFEPSTSYRIKNEINLAVTERPSVKYGVDYQSTDLGLAGGLMQGSNSALDAIGNAFSPEATRAMLLNVAQIPASIASAFGSNFDPGALASLGSATTPNPFREQLFKSVDNRTFTFDYKFLPRSESEYYKVKNIIREFKFHMHPEVSAGGLFYIYPSDFTIQYMYKGKENPHIHKISTCVLENMSVDYGSQSGFNTFANGAPTEITMRLQFKELEVMTKERIKQGF
jgi:hypothetical protein